MGSKYMIILVLVAVIAAFLFMIYTSHVPGVRTAGSTRSMSYYEELSELLSNVPKPSVCIVASSMNDYVGNLTVQLSRVDVPYSMMSVPVVSANCSMYVISSDWIVKYGTEYRNAIISVLSKGIPVESMGPNAGNALLNVISDYIESRAAVVIGVPINNGSKLVRPELPNDVTALIITTIPGGNNETRLPTGWEIFTNILPDNITFTTLKSWRDYNEMLSQLTTPISVNTNVVSFSGLRYGEVNFQTLSGISIQVQGFSYVGYAGWYSTSASGAGASGVQDAMVKFYYAYQQSPGPYYWFLNVILHEVTAYNGVPSTASETVYGYTNYYPGQIFWGAAPTGVYSQGTISFTIGAGISGVYATVTFSEPSGLLTSLDYYNNPTQGIDQFAWAFTSIAPFYPQVTGVVVPTDVWMLDPSKPGGSPPFFESITFSSSIEPWYIVPLLNPNSITITVDVWPTNVNILSVTS